jgi:hypothetical protein
MPWRRRSDAAEQQINSVLQVTLLLLGTALDTAVGGPRGQMFNHRDEVAGGQLEIVHLDGPSLLVARQQVHHLPMAPR